MSRTTNRTLGLLDLLQTGRIWSGAALHERLGVSTRTLRRDVEDLRGIGYGIESVPGVGGGYRLGIGSSIPPLTLTSEEAVAIAVGLRAGALSAVTGLEDASARALAKLEQSLSSETRERIATVERALVPLSGGGEAVDMDTVVAVARAIRESRRLRIDYRRHDGEEVRRIVEPHRIVHTAERWYLVARDVERDAWRTLRLDRLTPRLPLDAEFTPTPIPEDQLRAFTTQSISVAPYPHRVRLLMHAPVLEVSAQFGPAVAEIVDRDDGTCVLTTGSASLDEIALYVGTSGFEFEILDGEGLRNALRTLVGRFERALTADGGR